MWEDGVCLGVKATEEFITGDKCGVRNYKNSQEEIAEISMGLRQSDHDHTGTL